MAITAVVVAAAVGAAVAGGVAASKAASAQKKGISRAIGTEQDFVLAVQDRINELEERATPFEELGLQALIQREEAGRRAIPELLHEALQPAEVLSAEDRLALREGAEAIRENAALSGAAFSGEANQTVGRFAEGVTARALDRRRSERLRLLADVANLSNPTLPLNYAGNLISQATNLFPTLGQAVANIASLQQSKGAVAGAGAAAPYQATASGLSSIASIGGGLAGGGATAAPASGGTFGGGGFALAPEYPTLTQSVGVPPPLYN